jgi:succinoglycan biosynthesis transport protein ExoP
MLIARRRAWIVILLMLIAGSVAYVNSSRETKIYSTSATMMISSSGQSTLAPDYNSVATTQFLAETYRMLVTSSTVMDRVASTLGYDTIPSGVSASLIEGSQFIVVNVTDTDPARAAQVANAVVAEFEIYVDELAADQASNRLAGIDTQLAAYDTRINEIDDQLAELNVPENADDPEIQQQISDLQQERATYNQERLALNTSRLTLSAGIMASSPQIDLASAAQVPTVPIEPKPRQALMLGLFVGLMLGIGVVALLEFLDNTVKPEQNLQEITGAPVLATISSMGKLQPGGAQVYTMAQPQSSATEAMRLLRTNLDFASASGPINILTVTSPGPGEGKSTVTANIGVVMAQGGLEVAIIDADLRKPTQHRVFGIPNDRGLTTLLTHPEEDWRNVVTKVALPGLSLIPSGPLPPNPADLVASNRFEELLARIGEDVDLILIDSPPVLSASDSLAIAARSDGVLLVCQSHKTRTDALRHAAHSVRQGGIRIVGVVLNRQKGQQGATYYGEYYGRVASQGD